MIRDNCAVLKVGNRALDNGDFVLTLQALSTYAIIRVHDLYYASDKSVYQRMRSWLLSYAKRLPSVRKEIQAKAAEQGKQLEHELLDKQVAVIATPHSSLPITGLTHDEVLQMAEKYIKLGIFAKSELRY